MMVIIFLQFFTSLAQSRNHLCCSRTRETEPDKFLHFFLVMPEYSRISNVRFLWLYFNKFTVLEQSCLPVQATPFPSVVNRRVFPVTQTGAILPYLSLLLAPSSHPSKQSLCRGYWPIDRPAGHLCGETERSSSSLSPLLPLSDDSLTQFFLYSAPGMLYPYHYRSIIPSTISFFASSEVCKSHSEIEKSLIISLKPNRLNGKHWHCHYRMNLCQFCTHSL